MKIYVASSWRNLHQPRIVDLLRKAGHEVYDFKRPAPGDAGFHWSDIDLNWKAWTVSQYAKGLEHPLAVSGHGSDMRALQDSNLCILLLPSGRSASFEYGWWCAHNVATGLVHMPDAVEPELMYRGSLFSSTDNELTANVVEWGRAWGLY